MEVNRITLPPITGPGEVSTFYSFDGGDARSAVLAHAAWQLAGRQNASLPVLMIDWDLEAPGLHLLFPPRDERELLRFDSERREGARADASPAAHGAPARPGLLEYFEACREQLALLERGCVQADAQERARLVLEAIDWEAYVERVDQGRTLYLMRAGRFDDSYGERAGRMDWDALFAACPVLFRAFAAHLARHFRHILVDCRGGRSAAVSVCTTLLPDKLVGVFTPAARSLDGLAGVVARAIEYRCSHEEAQHPLLVYPLPCAEGIDAERRLLWRRGDPGRGLVGYQGVLEHLLRTCYGLSQVSLDSYLDEVQLQETGGGAAHAAAMPVAQRSADRLSLARGIEALLGWAADGRFPWQSRAELALQDAVAAARAATASAPGGEGDANGALLARELFLLGELHCRQGRVCQARECFQESLDLRQRLLGGTHAATRASRAALAAAMQGGGDLAQARVQYDLLLEHCLADGGPSHPEALAARSGLAATLASLDDFPQALMLHEQVVDACERQFGPGHVATLDALAGQAGTLAQQGEYSRARMLYERVLEGRQRILGTEHEATLRCTQQLAILLRDMGDLGNARKLQESVLQVRERLDGADAAATLQARETLAQIFAAQGDLGAVRDLQQALASARARHLGSAHPDTLGGLLRLASTLTQQGELEGARRLRQHVASLHERLRGMDDQETLHREQLLAQTLSSQDHGVAARRLEQSMEEGGSRLRQLRALAAGLHEVGSAGACPAPVPAAAREAGLAQAAAMGGAGDALEHRLGQLRKLIESGRTREARSLADSLREAILRPGVTRPLRRRGVALIKQVYLDDGDKDALLALAEDEVAALEGALIEAADGRPLALR